MSGIDIDRLTHASVCLDIALEAATNGDNEKAQEYITKCFDDLTDFIQWWKQ
tara:strand:+ start:181 stop:336 length:156 start_codon:yes stop_codon:yes gene_type:complete